MRKGFPVWRSKDRVYYFRRPSTVSCYIGERCAWTVCPIGLVNLVRALRHYLVSNRVFEDFTRECGLGPQPKKVKK